MGFIGISLLIAEMVLASSGLDGSFALKEKVDYL